MAEYSEDTTGVEKANNAYSRSKNELLPWIASGWSHTVSTGERGQSQKDKTKPFHAAIELIIN